MIPTTRRTLVLLVATAMVLVGGAGAWAIARPDGAIEVATRDGDAGPSPTAPDHASTTSTEPDERHTEAPAPSSTTTGGPSGPIDLTDPTTGPVANPATTRVAAPNTTTHAPPPTPTATSTPTDPPPTTAASVTTTAPAPPPECGPEQMLISGNLPAPTQVGGTVIVLVQGANLSGAPCVISVEERIELKAYDSSGHLVYHHVQIVTLDAPRTVKPGDVVWAIYQVTWHTGCTEPNYVADHASFTVLVCEPVAPGQYTMAFTMDGGVWGPEPVTITE